MRALRQSERALESPPDPENLFPLISFTPFFMEEYVYT
jgi:hypothetical protein